MLKSRRVRSLQFSVSTCRSIKDEAMQATAKATIDGLRDKMILKRIRHFMPRP